MTTYTLPGDEKKIPKDLLDGDILNVNANGTSHNITIHDMATENVNRGGKSDHTTILEGGMEIVQGGGSPVTSTTIDQTTINGGGLLIFHATADHTKLNFSISFPLSEFDIRDGSVAKHTVIAGGGFLGSQHESLSMRPAGSKTSSFKARTLNLIMPYWH